MEIKARITHFKLLSSLISYANLGIIYPCVHMKGTIERSNTKKNTFPNMKFYSHSVEKFKAFHKSEHSLK